MALSSFSQTNLVQNSSFENGINKGIGVQEVKGKSKEITDWHSPIKHAPDLYMTPRKSVAVANSGRNAVGLILGSNRQEKTKFEYLTGKLSSPLVAGQAYCISFSTILHRTSKWAATDLGVILHNDEKLLSKISDPTSLSASLYANDGAAITNTKWNKFNGYYVATGDEKYISFGKFGDAESVQIKGLDMDPYFELDGFQSKAYYQLDDVSVKALSEDTDCGCAEDPPKTEEELEVINHHKQPPYLFALDASGSMKRDGLFDTLRQNLVRFVENVPKGTAVSFVTFASSSRKVFTGAVESNTAQTVDSLLSRSPIGGGTNVFVGLQLAYASWQLPGRDSAKMILISDGEFHVSPKILEIVKNNYETKGRKLTLIQIGARASGLEQLKPYMDEYIHTTQSELKHIVAQLNKKKIRSGGNAVNCECVEAYSDTMNYHFVIDFSGSMKDEKNRAIMALKYLFNQAPDDAMMSVTTFNTNATKLYSGKKSDITMTELTVLLHRQYAGGGTDPTPGIKQALHFAKSESKDRYSHVILITDLTPKKLSQEMELGKSIKRSTEEFDMSAQAITVSDDGFVAVYSQFDVFTKGFTGVSRTKFEKDLFDTERSSCDYTSQPYHYNPAKAAAKAGTKKFAAKVLKGILNSTLSL